jgi:lysophospholipase L1-like esterase
LPAKSAALILLAFQIFFLRIEFFPFAGWLRGATRISFQRPVIAAANRAEIRRQLHARGIRTIEADGYVMAALRSGLRQSDGIHMTAEGHRRVAEQLATSIH